MNNIRQLSHKLIVEILQKKNFSNLVIKENINKIDNNKDKSLLVRIVLGTIQNKLYLENIVSKYINPEKTNMKIKILFWMSLYQFLFCDRIPEYAIVYEAVHIAKSINVKLSGFVNATLKKMVSLENPNIHNESYDPNNIVNEEEFLLRYSFPKDLYNLLIKQYSDKVSEINSFVIDNTTTPKISFRVNTLRISVEDFLEKFPEWHFVPSAIAKNVFISKLPLVNSEMHKNGLIYLQDEMSAKVVEFLEISTEDKVLDMCTAPGGKASYIAQLLNDNGNLTCYDISTSRSFLVEENFKKLGIKNAKLNVADSAKIVSDVKYNKILIDAPCSGYGVIKRKPEIKYNIGNISDKKLLSIIQIDLLNNAKKLLAKDGIIVYSTCTINKLENHDIITKFLAENKDFELLFEEQKFGFEDNTDGFYIAKLKKTT